MLQGMGRDVGKPCPLTRAFESVFDIPDPLPIDLDCPPCPKVFPAAAMGEESTGQANGLAALFGLALTPACRFLYARLLSLNL